MAKIIDIVNEEVTFLQFENCACTVQERQDFSNLFDILFRRLAKYDAVVEIDEAELLLTAGDDNVHRALERSWRLTKSERHSYKSV